MMRLVRTGNVGLGLRRRGYDEANDADEQRRDRARRPAQGQAQRAAGIVRVLYGAAYCLVPKSTLGVFISSAAMSNVAISLADGYMTARQMRPGNVVISVL